ncbi:LemA family protein, partial [Candidatus Gracilibacteria bacterium]|nr:LemA family protein [Candidatus Gracilibacteria bacterium]
MSRKFLSPLLIFGIVATAIGIWTAASYNSLVSLEENVDNSFAKIETQFQRRLDLIPNVVSTVKRVA